jgi:hypothetical protein
MKTDKVKDSDLLAVMIYRSFVVPEMRPVPPDTTFISFRDALDFYARTVSAEAAQPEPDQINDSEQDPDPEPAPELGEEPAPNAEDAKPTELFSGYGAGEKREVYARLMAFVAAHGLGARRKIALCSEGALTMSDVQDMTDAKRVTLNLWQAAAAAMDRIEAEEAAE